MGFGGGGFGGFGGLGGMGGGGEGQAGEQGGPMGLLETTIPGLLLFLGIALVGTGLFLFSMVKVWSPRIWLPILFGVGIALGGQLFRFRSRKMMGSFGAAEVCEICNVELALQECFSCGKWFGPGCEGKFINEYGNVQAEDTRCIECTTCSICGQPTKGFRCLKCDKRVCAECLDETQRYCLQCGGRLKIAKGAVEEEAGKEISDAKVVVLKSPFNLPSALVRKITDKVKSDMVGQELLLGKTYPSLGTQFRLVGSSPGGRVVVREDTRVKIEN